jgi:hypothetical protein
MYKIHWVTPHCLHPFKKYFVAKLRQHFCNEWSNGNAKAEIAPPVYEAL